MKTQNEIRWKSDFENNRGFTLLEVMLAVVIMGIVVVLIMNLFSGALRNQKIGTEYLKASILARTKMDKILLSSDIEPGESQGEFDPPYNNYSWKTKISPVSMTATLGEDEIEKRLEKADNIPEIFKIEVRVIWKNGAKEYKLTTMKTIIKPMEGGFTPE